MFVFTTTRGASIADGAQRGRSTKPYVVPNPYVGVGELRARALRGLRAAASGGSSSAPSRGTATIRIYTVRGDLVQTLRQDGSTNGFVPWNLRTKDNLDVAPGLYIFHVDAGDARDAHRQVRDHQVSEAAMKTRRMLPSALLRRSWRRAGRAQTQDRHDDRPVPADRAERAHRRRWGTPGCRSAASIESRRTTTRRRSGCSSGTGVQFTHSAWLADITYDYVGGGAPARASSGTLFAQRHLAQLRRDRRAHGRASRSAPASATPSPTSRSASATAGRSPTASRPGVQVTYAAGDDLAQLAERVRLQRRHGLPALGGRPPDRREHLELRDPGEVRRAAICGSSTTPTRTATATTARCRRRLYHGRLPAADPVPGRRRLCRSTLGEDHRARWSRSTPSTRATTPRA